MPGTEYQIEASLSVQPPPNISYIENTGSNNPIGPNRNIDKIPFHPYFSIKDTVGSIILIIILTILTLKEPYILGDVNSALRKQVKNRSAT